MASQSVRSFLNKSLTASETSAPQSMAPNDSAFIGLLVGTNVDAGTTVDVIIEHSPDRTNWFTLATFSQLNGVDGSEAIQITDSVFVNTRADVTLGGTAIADVKCQLWYDPGKNR